MRKSSNQTPEKGDLVCVDWYDIMEDPTGDVSSSDVPLRSTFSIFWEIAASPSHPNLQVLRTTNTKDSDKNVVSQTGFTAYPLGAVKSITVLKKAKKAGAKRGPRSVQLHIDRHPNGDIPVRSLPALAETKQAGREANPVGRQISRASHPAGGSADQDRGEA